MIRLTVVTLAALYAVLYVFGDEARRPAEVSRAEGPGLTVDLGRYLPDLPSVATVSATSGISEAEAVTQALAAGQKIRAARTAEPRRGAVVLASADGSGAGSADGAAGWFVTGERVNLRGGPGTSNAVVGEATFGMEAEMLEDRNGWYRIRLADGSEAWIFGKFLSAQRPG